MHLVSYSGPSIQHSRAMTTEFSACSIYFGIAYLWQRRGNNHRLVQYSCFNHRVVTRLQTG